MIPGRTPTIIFARSALEVMQREASRYGSRIILDHDQAVGGILIGKRIAGDRIVVVAATAPGPSPTNRQMGFALDPGHANAVLEQWFDRDPAVDFIGLWHTHPPDLGQPTPADVEIAQKLFADPAYNATELVNPIVLIGGGVAPSVRCFYLNRDDAGVGRGLNFVQHQQLDASHPVFLEPGVAAAAVARAADPVPASPVEVQPRIGPALDAPDEASPRRRTLALVGFATLIVVLLLAALYLARGVRDPVDQASGGVLQVETTATALVIDELATPFSNDQTAVDSDALATAAPQASVPVATSTPNATVTSGPTPDASPLPEQTAEPGATTQSEQAGATSPPATATASFPYALRVEPIPEEDLPAFLDRAELLECPECYNVDIVSPSPYTEMRIEIVGEDRPALVNYPEPSLAGLDPRPEPYTLQLFELDGPPLSEPVTVTIDEDVRYMLRIEALTGP